MSFAWTPAALDALYRLYVQEGLSAGQAARTLGGGVTRNAVLSKALRMGWRRFGGGRQPPAPPRSESVATCRPPCRPRSPFSCDIPRPPLKAPAVQTTPRPWIERGERECAFPVGEPAMAELQLSCCAPVQGQGRYCPAHRRLMFLEGTALTEKDAAAILEIARRAA